MFDYNKLKDSTFFKENVLPAHSDHEYFPDEEHLRNKENPFRFSLNGIWKFSYGRNLSDTVKDFESRQKAEKELEVKAYYDKKAFVLGEYAEPLYAKLLDAKWLNVSTAKAKYEEGVQIAINNALSDINAIKAMESPFVDTLIETYLSSLSMEQVKAKNEELTAAHNKAGLSRTPVSENVSPIQAVQSQEVKPTANADEGTLLKVYATQYQLNQITDFMKAIGVTYEVQ